MIRTIYGPFDEPIELRSAEDSVAADDGLLCRDPVWLEQYVPRLLENPSNRDGLRRLLEDDTSDLAWPPDDEQLCRLLSRRLSMGTLVLIRPRLQVVGLSLFENPAVEQAAATATQTKEPEPKPKEPEVKVRDWKIECKHHAAGSRPFFERGTSIQVVPDKGKTKDTVTVHWRDDSLGSMPPSLALTTAGRPAAEAKQSGGGGGFTAYKGEVEYRGHLDELRFPLPPFWSALNEKTSYTFGPGPQSIGVEVYNPRQFKLELKFPALESFSAGYKYSASSSSIEGGSLSKLSMAKKKTVKETLTVSETGWKPSKRGHPRQNEA